MKYTIVNIVALASLNNTLDLYELASVIPNMEYEPAFYYSQREAGLLQKV